MIITIPNFENKKGNLIYEIYFMVIYFVILTLFKYIGFLLQFLFKDNLEFWTKWFRTAWRIIFFATFMKIESKLKFYKPKLIYASNHESPIDGLIYNYAIKGKLFALTQPIDKFPKALQFWVRKTNCVPVWRDEKDYKWEEGLSKREAIKKCIEQMKTESLLIFPEGHTEKPHYFLKFHTGAVRIALESRVNIIPCHIFYSNKIVDIKLKWVKPGYVKIIYGKEWDLSKYYGKQNDFKLVKKLTLELRKKIIGLKP